MTAKSHSNGYEVYFDEKEEDWKYSDTDSSVKNTEARPCQKCGKHQLAVQLCSPRQHSKLEWAYVDHCIGPLVEVLNQYGIKTTNSCCGHGQYPGSIIIDQLGTQITLIIPEKEVDNDRREKM